MEKPFWLQEIINTIEQLDLDEIIIKATGEMIGTKVNKNFLIKNHTNKNKNFTRSVQEFSFSQNLRLDPNSPFAGGSLEGSKYRWQSVLPPASKETLFFLRKHRFEDLKLSDFKASKEIKGKLKTLAEKKASFLICGATGSGKTSFLTAFLKENFSKKRILILEDYEEIPLASPFWSKLLSKKEDIQSKKSLALNLLFKESLRLRPDQLVLGELRDTELLTFLEASHSGHLSTCSTIHANSPRGLKNRIKLILSKQGLSDQNIFIESELCCIFLEGNSEGFFIKDFYEQALIS